jgi:hypothetical protein
VRLRALVGELAGVKAGDVVTLKGVRYRVSEILSDAIPSRGKPILSGFKIAKNGNAGKRPVTIKGAWAAEGGVPAVVAGASRPKKAGRKASASLQTAPKRRGRPSKKALEEAAVLGTA